MTGFGKGEAEKHGYRHSVRLKSVNNRFLELALKLPADLWGFEAEARALFQQGLSRGKVDIFWREERPGAAQAVRPNLELAHAYKKALEELSQGLALPGEARLEFVARFPEVISASASGEEAEESGAKRWEGLKQALIQALADLNASRAREGAELVKELKALLERSAAITKDIEAEGAKLKPLFEERLRKKMEEIFKGQAIDETRMLQEVAMLAEKADIREEIVRFGAHVGEFSRLLNAGGVLGKKLDFLSQELLREANTMGSKSPDAGLTRLVVDLKAQVEKIKEQIQNLE